MDELEKLLKAQQELEATTKQLDELLPSKKPLNPLKQDINLVKGTKPLPESKSVIKGVTEHIKTKNVEPLLTGNQFKDKIQKILASRAASKGLKALPIIGPAIGAISALSSGDVSAAVPVLDQIESLGPKEGSIDKMIEDGTITLEQLQAIKKARGL